MSTSAVRKALIGMGAAALLGGVFLAGQVTADQPHMHKALAQLQGARAELNMAIADKGGHRVKAIELVDQAIAEVQAGIEYDRTH